MTICKIVISLTRSILKERVWRHEKGKACVRVCVCVRFELYVNITICVCWWLPNIFELYSAPLDYRVANLSLSLSLSLSLTFFFSLFLSFSLPLLPSVEPHQERIVQHTHTHLPKGAGDLSEFQFSRTGVMGCESRPKGEGPDSCAIFVCKKEETGKTPNNKSKKEHDFCYCSD